MIIAAAISASNVAIAALGTYFGRNLNHRRWYWKLFGLAAALIGIGLCLGFNLGVAHLRDALERGLELEAALTQSWASLWRTPLALASFLSALLMLVGVVAAIVVGLKTYHAIDPYPGYPAIFATVTRARDAYAENLDRAIADLDASRDGAIADLRDANQEMRLWIREAVDALYGQSSLRSELDRFLEHCDDKANTLLAVYRDANRAARPAEGGPRGAGAFQRPLRLSRDAPAAAGGGGARRRDPRAEAGERAGVGGDRGHPRGLSRVGGGLSEHRRAGGGDRRRRRRARPAPGPAAGERVARLAERGRSG